MTSSSTTLPEAREAIYELFNTDWGITTLFTFDNEKFDPEPDVTWARLSVRHTASTQETLGNIGNRQFSRLARVFVQLFTPIDQGANAGDLLAAQARAIFEGKRIPSTTIRFYDVNVNEAGRDKSWFQIVVEATFEYNELK